MRMLAGVGLATTTDVAAGGGRGQNFVGLADSKHACWAGGVAQLLIPLRSPGESRLLTNHAGGSCSTDVVWHVHAFAVLVVQAGRRAEDVQTLEGKAQVAHSAAAYSHAVRW